MTVFLLYVAHSLFWFCLGALGSVVRGKGGAMNITSSIAIGIASASLHLILRYLQYINY